MFIRRLEKMLALFAIVVTVSLFVWPQLTKQRDLLHSIFNQEKASFNHMSSVDMAKVVFSSEDKKGQAFKISADKVLEADTQKKLVRLDILNAQMCLNSGILLSASSSFGYFSQNEEILTLPEKVKVVSDNGYEMDTSDVTLYHQQEKVKSHQVVSIRGTKMDLDAEGFYLFDNGDKVNFLGKSKLIVKDDNGRTRYIITAQNGIDVRQAQQTAMAKKDAILETADGRTLYADTLIGYFKKTNKGHFELDWAEAKGNVKIVTNIDTITGQYAVYQTLYQTAQIEGDVILSREGSQMRGERAIIDMKTGVSQMFGSDSPLKSKGRVKGILLPSELKKDKIELSD